MMTPQVISESINQVDSLPLRVDVASRRDLEAILQQDDVLMVLDFSEKRKFISKDPRLVSVGLTELEIDPSIEVWRGDGTVTCNNRGRISWCQNNDILIGHLLIEESDIVDIQVSIEQAYKEISEFLNTSLYPHVFRFWNYVPNINRVENGIEHYQSFCIGRYAAWSKELYFEQALPAASAVGNDSTEFLISFAASKLQAYPIENPRQISAFHYPPMYSPKSPLFSRAVSMGDDNGKQHQLFISGTASIVGHETRHVGDVCAQTVETCKNIETLIDCFAKSIGDVDTSQISIDYLRIYLRDSDQLPVVRELINKNLNAKNLIFTRADICRVELMLEVEGVCSYTEEVS